MISSSERGYLAPLRSYLFVPAHRENLIPKALATGVDALIMDLEDACPPAEKANGRKGARKAMESLDWGRAKATVRMNSLETPLWQEDLEAIVCKELYEIRTLFGVMFQDGALFGSMSLFDNTAFPLREHTKKKESEGVFIVTNGKATFRAVKVGIAGDEYFEVLDGVKEGGQIVAGPYQAIRDLKDGTPVRATKTPADTARRAGGGS